MDQRCVVVSNLFLVETCKFGYSQWTLRLVAGLRVLDRREGRAQGSRGMVQGARSIQCRVLEVRRVDENVELVLRRVGKARNVREDRL